MSPQTNSLDNNYWTNPAVLAGPPAVFNGDFDGDGDVDPKDLSDLVAKYTVDLLCDKQNGNTQECIILGRQYPPIIKGLLPTP